MILLWKNILLRSVRTIYHVIAAAPYLTMDIFYCIQEFLKGLGEGNVTFSPEVRILSGSKVIVSVDTTKMYLKEQFQAAIEQGTVSQMTVMEV